MKIGISCRLSRRDIGSHHTFLIEFWEASFESRSSTCRRISIAPNGMALIAVGSFFMIRNCSRAVWFFNRFANKGAEKVAQVFRYAKEEIIWEVKLNEHSLYFTFSIV